MQATCRCNSENRECRQRVDAIAITIELTISVVLAEAAYGEMRRKFASRPSRPGLIRRKDLQSRHNEVVNEV